MSHSSVSAVLMSCLLSVRVRTDLSSDSRPQPIPVDWDRRHQSVGGSVPISWLRRVPHTHTHPFNGPLFRTNQVSRYQKGKTNLDFTEAGDGEWPGISWAICKSAPRSRQTAMPAPRHSDICRTQVLNMIMIILPPCTSWACLHRDWCRVQTDDGHMYSRFAVNRMQIVESAAALCRVSSGMNGDTTCSCFVAHPSPHSLFPLLSVLDWYWTTIPEMTTCLIDQGLILTRSF